MKNDKSPLGKVVDLIGIINDRVLPIIHAENKISEIVTAFTNAPHSRIIYVVDQQNVLQGIITLGRIVRHVLVHYHACDLDRRSVFTLALAEKAADFMQPESIRITKDDNLEKVLEQMIEHDVVELPVVDELGRLVHDITMVDIMNYYHKVRGSQYLNNHAKNHL